MSYGISKDGRGRIVETKAGINDGCGSYLAANRPRRDGLRWVRLDCPSGNRDRQAPVLGSGGIWAIILIFDMALHATTGTSVFFLVSFEGIDLS